MKLETLLRAKTWPHAVASAAILWGIIIGIVAAIFGLVALTLIYPVTITVVLVVAFFVYTVYVVKQGSP